MAGVFLLLAVSVVSTWSNANDRQNLKQQLIVTEEAAERRELAAGQERAEQRSELQAVRGLLDPFLKYASEHYPTDDSSEALSKVLRDLQIHERQIADLKAGQGDLQLKANTINTFELRATIDTRTPERRTESMRRSLAINFVGLTTGEGTTLRFEADRYLSGQPAPTLGRIAFTYRPEDPTGILGQQIDFLRTIKKFVANYQEFFAMVGFEVDPEGAHLVLDVLVNGVVVGRITSLVPRETLRSGQMAMDVSAAFQSVPDLYTQQVKKRAIR